MSAPFSAYLDLLHDLSGYLDQLSELARQKVDVVRQDDLLALDEVLKQEQAMTLTLRGLEQRRVKLVKELGLEGTSLIDLPQKSPEELEDRARQTAEELRGSYKIYRSCADTARNTLELNLHQIEKLAAAAGTDPAVLGAGYEAPGVEPPKNMKTDFRA